MVDANKKMLETLKQEMITKNKETDALRNEILKKKQELDKQGSLLKPDARNKLEEELSAKKREFRRFMEENQAELDEENRGWNKKITQALGEVIEDLGRERGYTAIFAKGQVLYADSAIDLTKEVAERLNKKTQGWF
ncbi:MAG: OmpH family outer membrane protein [Magnetococcales bacterium]|nr:OmpH family outer membrane protein [Magnetococcales bacterium]